MIEFVYNLLTGAICWDIAWYWQLHSTIHQLKMLNISVKTEFSYVHHITFITTFVFLIIVKIFDFLNTTNINKCCVPKFKIENSYVSSLPKYSSLKRNRVTRIHRFKYQSVCKIVLVITILPKLDSSIGVNQQKKKKL